ncbi:MAG: TVP38/TMEM64 family protein [Halobacteriovoraceae bacterium]|nr:TVP38/TMEM64 family protein [Halobacteriovoraceae bacterium]
MIKKILIISIVILSVVTIKYFELEQYVTFDIIKQNQIELQNYYVQNKFMSIGLYFCVYIFSTALSLPIATVLTLLGGAVFGFWTGLLIISFASTIGATVSFYFARILLADYIEKKFSKRLKIINAGMEKEGSFYLFTLRVVPIIPFFVINLVMGLTRISVRRYFVISQIGMLAGTIVYVNAGVQLARLESIQEIMNPQIILSLTLLGLFPFAAKKIIYQFKKKAF